MTPDARLRPRLNLTGLVVAVSVALVAVIWAAVTTQVRFEREQALAEAVTRQANLVIAFEEYSVRTIDAARTLIRYILRELDHGTAPLDLPDLVKDVGLQPDFFDGVSLIDAAGNVVAAAAVTDPDRAINIADRDHFTVHRDRDIGGVFIGKPVVSRRTGTLMVPVTHRVNTRDSRFNGILSVQVSPSRFTASFGAALPGDRDVFSLVGLDGVTRARRVGRRLSAGEDISRSPLMTHVAAQPTGHYIGPGAIDGVERLYSYRRMANYPLISTVGVPMADILAGATARSRWYYRNALIVTAGILVAAGFLGLALARRREIFDRLRTSQQRLRALFEHSSEAIVLTNDAARFVEMNPAARTLLGRSRDELLAIAVTDVVTPEANAVAQAQWATLLTAGRAAGEIAVRRPDGSTRDVEYNAVANIEPGVHLAVFRDITERKLAQQQSFRAQRMESIGTLAGGIAHDLNNALAPILMAVSVLRDEEEDPSKRELIETIDASAKRGADMVRQVLSFARGVEGRRVPVALDVLIRDVERMVNDTFLKHIRLTVAIPPGLPPVVGDPTQLHQVLVNLCVNARDAMPNGGTLTISAEQVREKDGPYIAIGIEDTGTGIDPAILDRIFDPFFTTKAVGQGTGLGLSASLTIVRRHGGFMRVESQPGRGTAFRVYLPVPTDLPPGLESGTTPASLPRANGEQILVIDDEAAIRHVTRRALEQHGYRVRTAASGTEGVATYAAHSDDIAAVITDMMMPGLDGASTMAALREVNPRVTLIAASGLAEDGRVTRAREAGAQHFLPKPFTTDQLLQALHQALRGGPGAPSA